MKYQFAGEREGSGGFPVIVIWFSLGKRKFQLDGVIHSGETPDDRTRNAVIKIATIAKNLRATLNAPDGAGQLKIERLLS